ncbi:MAG: hypothetical protein RMI31_07030 [Archaeoglobaceae archaeon]|nr:hypothetical protein [Archaeoglobaceae archaeon]
MRKYLRFFERDKFEQEITIFKPKNTELEIMRLNVVSKVLS